MLKLTIPSSEMWDEANECFISTKETEIALEHSLVSISKWEQKYHKSFFTSFSGKGKNSEIPQEEFLEYVKCMTITQNIPDDVYNALSSENLVEILNYINDPATATVIKNTKRTPNQGTFITNELIYYQMVEHGIPFECQKWHINRLLTLIQVCNNHSGDQKKMSKKDIYKSNDAINRARRARMRSRG